MARGRMMMAVAATALALVVAGCSGEEAASGGSGGRTSFTPGGARDGGGEGGKAIAEQRESDSGAQAQAAAPESGSAQPQLAEIGDRIIRRATVELQVGKGELDETITRATQVVTRHDGLYVGSSTSAPEKGPASGQVTFRVPVAAYEAALRELKGLGSYRGEESSTEDVSGRYVDLRGQLQAWRAQEQAFVRLLREAKSVEDIIAVQAQLQEVQSNINRLQGQVNFLEEQSAFSTITLNLTEPGAAAAPRGRLAEAWETAVNGLAAIAAALLIGAVWLLPLAALAAIGLLAYRAARARRPVVEASGPSPPAS